MKFIVRAWGMRKVSRAAESVYEILDTEWRAPQEEVIVTEHEKLKGAGSGLPWVRVLGPSNEEIRQQAEERSRARREQQGRPKTEWVVRRSEAVIPPQQKVRPLVDSATAAPTSSTAVQATHAQAGRLTRQNHLQPAVAVPASENQVQPVQTRSVHTMTDAYGEAERPEKPLDRSGSGSRHWTISCMRVPELESLVVPPINDHHLVFPGSFILVANEGTSASGSDGGQAGGADMGAFDLVYVSPQLLYISHKVERPFCRWEQSSQLCSPGNSCG
jgi:hypothetical protein